MPRKPWFLTLILLFMTTGLQASVPQELHYNGYLTNAVGEGIDCADLIQCPSMFNLSFRLYASEDSEDEVWQEDHVGVPIYQGSFHVSLGTEEAFTSSDFDGPRWLGITVNGGVELSPRQKLAASPFALRAGVADEAENATKLGGMNAGDYATQSSLTEIESNLAPVATEGLSAELADGDDDTLGALVCAEGMVAKADASGLWNCGPDIDTDTTIEDTKLTEDEVDAMVANNNYAIGAHTVDTDTDTQLTEAEVDAFVANNGYSTGAHTVDTDTKLTEDEVDAMVANNGYFTGNPVPSGIISMWSGSPDVLPPGWVLCDGTNGTPNLLDRFILSIPSASASPGAEGGSHTKTVGHTHSFSGGTGGVGPTGCGACANPSPNFVGGHSHSFSGTTETTEAEVDVRPRFYTLAFIMKL